MSGDIEKTIGLIKSVLPEGLIISDPEELARFKTSNPLLKTSAGPLLCAQPANVNELQDLVKLANDRGLRLVPVSSAGPHCKGGTSCGEDTIVVDLSPWKKMLYIDRRNRVCMIEPGVTYGELLDALEPHGLTVSTPLAPRNTKSVAAAIMDREPSTWPNKQWDICDPVASTEFIFGTGDIFRTGAAGGPGSLEKQRESGGAQKSPMGPSQTDFQRVVQGSQGSMGIVTWLSVRAELLPSIQEPRLVGSDDLGALISFVYEVQRPWLGEHSFIINRTAAAMLMTDNNSDFEKLPGFICLQNIAGFDRMPEERVAYQLKDIEEIAARHGLSLESSLGPISAEDMLHTATRPCPDKDWRHSLAGQSLSIFFLSTLDRAPEFIEVLTGCTDKYKLDQDRIGIYIQPVVQNHACHIEFVCPLDAENKNDIELKRGAERDVVRQLADAGAFFSRPYGAASKVAFEKNRINTDILGKIKGIFDPNGVLKEVDS